MDCSPRGSSVHRISQQEYSSELLYFLLQEIFRPRDQTQVYQTRVYQTRIYIGRWILYH